MQITAAAASFTEALDFADIPEDAVKIAQRCIIDGIGLIIAGTEEHSVQILARQAALQGGADEVALVSGKGAKVPATVAARVMGTSGHAHDWDDTQVSRDPRHIYGLLTHPTIPPLTAALVMSEKLGGVSGAQFVTAFLAGFEVECKISEWTLPHLYKSGFHTSGTVGTFGSCIAAAKLLGLQGDALRHAIGIAASFAAGIRANFGSMTKPLHVGRAAENGVLAAELAAMGFTADPDALDGPWGFSSVFGEGVSDEKLAQGFGKSWSILDPGVSIKPYPSGILTHQSMDLMLRLVTEHDITPDAIDQVAFFAGSNILNPIRYDFAQNHLQAKFSMAALLSMIAVNRAAGRLEFTDTFVQSPAMIDMQQRVSTQLDPAIERMGFDKIRSRIEITLKSGDVVSGLADERYRGGPDNPMADADVEAKFAACIAGLVDARQADRILRAVRQLASAESTNELVAAMVLT